MLKNFSYQWLYFWWATRGHIITQLQPPSDQFVLPETVIIISTFFFFIILFFHFSLHFILFSFSCNLSQSVTACILEALLPCKVYSQYFNLHLVVFKENQNKAVTYNQNLKAAVETSRTYNDKRGLGEFNAHRTKKKVIVGKQ